MVTIGFSTIGSLATVGITLLPVLLGQIDEQTARNLEPDTATPMKLSALLAFLGLFVFLVGSFLVLWLFSRYVRRNYLGGTEPFKPSPFSEFSYKYGEQVKHDDADPDQDGLLPRKES